MLALALLMRGAGEAESGFRDAVSEAKRLDLAAPAAGVELNALGDELYLAARYADAETVYRLAVESFDRSGSQASVNRELTAANLGALLRAQGRYEEAERLLSAALRQLEILTGPDSTSVAIVASNLASLYWSRGELAKAEALGLRADAIFARFPAGDVLALLPWSVDIR